MCGVLRAQLPPLEQPVATPPYAMQDVRIPMQEAGPSGLRGLLVLPDLPGKHPLVLMENDDDADFHSVDSYELRMGPGLLLPEARWFVLRGWAVLVLSRRGYSDSGGKPVVDEYYSTGAEYEKAQIGNARDLRAAYDALAARPEIDTDHTIAVGYGMAGSAAMWLAKGEPPPGLKAVISFSGGRPYLPLYKKTFRDFTMVPAFRSLGAVSHTPELWFYRSKGDQANYGFAQAGYSAFTDAGGTARFETLKKERPIFGSLFASDPAEWGPIAETFLSSLGLPSAPVLAYSAPRVKHVPMGDVRIEEYYQQFLLAGPNKAYAAGPNGHAGFAAGMLTLQMAKDKALERCRDKDCKVVQTQGH